MAFSIGITIGTCPFDGIITVNAEIDRQPPFGETGELSREMKFEEIGVAIGHRAFMV